MALLGTQHLDGPQVTAIPIAARCWQNRPMAPAADKALDNVHLGDFEGFVARRDALAKELKGEGDSDAAEEVKALKKPSRTAWAVNQFAAHGKKLRTELLKAGTALRDAQEGLVSGSGDREAMIKARDRERAAVGKAVEAIAALAADAGSELNAAATDRVRQTLHAVALDDEVREQFEAARLVTDHEASGLGGGAGFATSGGGAGKARTPAREKSAARSKGDAAADRKREKEAERKRRAREELKAAEADATKRGRELESAELELKEATKAAERAQGDLKRATKKRDRAHAAADDAGGRLADLKAG